MIATVYHFDHEPGYHPVAFVYIQTHHESDPITAVGWAWDVTRNNWHYTGPCWADDADENALILANPWAKPVRSTQDGDLIIFQGMRFVVDSNETSGFREAGPLL